MKLFGITWGIFVAAGLVGGDLYSDKRRISLEAGSSEWMNEAQIHQLVRDNRRFRDITDIDFSTARISQPSTSFPSTVTQQAAVEPLLKQVSRDLPTAVLRNFTQFNNRYFNSKLGQQSSEYLFSMVQETGGAAKVSKFTHKFPQSSVIARLEGTSSSDEIVVVSAHQDSINQANHAGRAPGADDDGSGTVAILEVLRVLAQSSLKLKRSVEFHWYAGEEGGLLGSADVVQAYKDKSVVADLHLDMVGFPASPPAVGIVTDYTESGASNLVRQLVGAYTDLPTVDFKCGYACSDHASWHDIGVRSALPFESQYIDYNSNIHSPNDSFDTVDFDHLLKYVNIALGFIVEVAGIEQ